MKKDLKIFLKYETIFYFFYKKLSKYKKYLNCLKNYLTELKGQKMKRKWKVTNLVTEKYKFFKTKGSNLKSHKNEMLRNKPCMLWITSMKRRLISFDNIVSASFLSWRWETKEFHHLQHNRTNACLRGLSHIITYI